MSWEDLSQCMPTQIAWIHFSYTIPNQFNVAWSNDPDTTQKWYYDTWMNLNTEFVRMASPFKGHYSVLTKNQPRLSTVDGMTLLESCACFVVILLPKSWSCNCYSQFLWLPIYLPTNPPWNIIWAMQCKICFDSAYSCTPQLWIMDLASSDLQHMQDRLLREKTAV